MKHRSTETSREPLLSVAIPAYNVEHYISECLDTLTSPHDGELEVIVVDDDSTDSTAEIAQRYARAHAHIKLIRKKNGGHGSTINSALRQATGRYFKVVDGDDMVDESSLKKLLGHLSRTDADIVLTDYLEYYMLTGTKKIIQNYRHLRPEVTHPLESAGSNDIFTEKGPLLASTTFKTNIFRSDPFTIDEHCYYVDMEYNFFVYQRAATVSYLPTNLYFYRLEREGQSMQRTYLQKNYIDHEKVCLRLASDLQTITETAPQKYDYLMRVIVAPLCRSHYQILTEYLRSRSLFWKFDQKLKQYPKVYHSRLISGKILSIHRTTHGVLVGGDILLRKLGGALKRLEKK